MTPDFNNPRISNIIRRFALGVCLIVGVGFTTSGCMVRTRVPRVPVVVKVGAAVPAGYLLVRGKPASPKQCIRSRGRWYCRL